MHFSMKYCILCHDVFRLVRLHSAPQNVKLCEWCSISFRRNLQSFLWAQILAVKHLENSQFTNSKPLLYSTGTCEVWKETDITHSLSLWKHYTRMCIPMETTKVFSWKHSLSTQQSTAISAISDTSQPLCTVSHHRCGNSISLQCHSQDLAGAELQILTTLFPENVYLALSLESCFLSQSSAYDQWPIISSWQSSSTLRIISPLSSSLSPFIPFSFAFAWLKVIICPRWKSCCLLSTKACRD